jgi:predicted alpha/beta hydrolase family esterase
MGSVTSSFIFHPPKKSNKYYSNIKYLYTQNNEKISYIEYNPNAKKIMIFSHGNASDISDYYDFKKIANEINVCIVVYDYIGYGKSHIYKLLNEKTCYKSHETIVKYYEKLNKDIYLVGQSLGTGVVVDYISTHDISLIKKVMLISPYKSICSVVYDSSLLYPINQFMSINKIKSINKKLKIYFYHGKNDKIINYNHSIILSSLCNSHLILLEDIGHNDILQYIDFNNFINS